MRQQMQMTVEVTVGKKIYSLLEPPERNADTLILGQETCIRLITYRTIM